MTPSKLVMKLYDVWNPANNGTGGTFQGKSLSTDDSTVRTWESVENVWRQQRQNVMSQQYTKELFSFKTYCTWPMKIFSICKNGVTAIIGCLQVVPWCFLKGHVVHSDNVKNLFEWSLPSELLLSMTWTGIQHTMQLFNYQFFQLFINKHYFHLYLAIQVFWQSVIVKLL